MDFTSQYKNLWPAVFLAVLLRSLGNPLGLTTAETKRWNSPTGKSAAPVTRNFTHRLQVFGSCF